MTMSNASTDASARPGPSLMQGFKATGESEMALFIARHEHAAERCPAGDPRMGPLLLAHLSTGSASRQGVTIKAEAVVNDAHTLYLIVDADSREQLDRFMTPFAQV